MSGVASTLLREIKWSARHRIEQCSQWRADRIWVEDRISILEKSGGLYRQVVISTENIEPLKSDSKSRVECQNGRYHPVKLKTRLCINCITTWFWIKLAWILQCFYVRVSSLRSSWMFSPIPTLFPLPRSYFSRATNMLIPPY